MKRVLICGFIFIFCTSFHTHRTESNKLSLVVGVDSRNVNNLSLKVTLINNTSDTVKYISMDCSWQESYRINSDKWKIDISICYKNGRVIISLPPHQSTSKILCLIKKEGISKFETMKFKIGFNFIPLNESKNIPSKFDYFFKIENIIWSNTITTNYISKK